MRSEGEKAVAGRAFGLSEKSHPITLSSRPFCMQTLMQGRTHTFSA